MNKSENLPTPKTKAKRIIPNLPLLEDKYITIFNTYATNALLGKKTFIKKDDDSRESIFKYADGQGFLFIKDYEEQTKKFDASTKKTYIYATSLLTKQNSLGQDIKQIKREVRFKIKDYQKDRGLKNYNETKKQLRRDINLLYNASIKFTGQFFDGKRKKWGTLETRIIDSKLEIQHGDVIVSFAPRLVEFLVKSGFLMSLPKACFSMSPIAFAIMFKLLTHARINKYEKGGKGKKQKKRKSFQIISVEKLLEAIGDIPSYEDVINSKNRHVQRRIIAPLIKGLDEILEFKDKPLKEWEFCNAKGNPLSKEQVEGINKKGNIQEVQSKKDKYYLRWDNFKDLYIKYKLNELSETEEVSESSDPALLSKNPIAPADDCKDV
jgi:hypothetical protein